MNGIIHLSTNSDIYSKPKTEDEIIKSIFDCIDRIFSIVRPRKLLYMAIDGVAPRAKLNQQRSRRFLELKDTLDKAEEIERIKSEILAHGRFLPEDQNEKEKIEHFDENCITSGTSFMSHLANCLRYYIYNRMNTNSAWRSIKVILSDANVPGEGEHKIMNYIRRQRAQSGYDPETHHVLYGTDADLILLSLATHEHYITIIRDEFNPGKPRLCDICRLLGHDFKECKGITKEKSGQNYDLSSIKLNDNKTKYVFVDMSILRDNLLDSLLKNDQLLFKWDFERFLDDWVFICLLIGNDFLPNLPSFDIYENVIDELLNIYIQNVPKFNDYLTDNGILKMELFEIILIEFGKKEDEKFKNRHKVNQQYQNNFQLSKIQVKPPINLDEYVNFMNSEIFVFIDCLLMICLYYSFIELNLYLKSHCLHTSDLHVFDDLIHRLKSRLKSKYNHMRHKLPVRQQQFQRNKKNIMIQMILFDSGKKVGMNDIIKVNLMWIKIIWINFVCKLLNIILKGYVGCFNIIIKVYHLGIGIYSYRII
jgi:5'-3' exoribonuclease 2